MFARRTSLTRNKQRGAAMMAMLVIMIMGSAAFLVSALNSSSLQIERDKKTADALAQAKEALIGYAASQGDTIGNPRPGDLPCPDTHAPGTIDYGKRDLACSPGKIGRLPWKTLGIEELKDGYGETLWYAIDGAFRSKSDNTTPINSDTRASMQVYEKDGSTLATPSGSEAVAIIFSPGTILTGQQRGTAAQQTTASNYLDSVAPPTVATARNNATTNGPFIRGSIKNSSGTTVVNDTLMIIATRDLIPLIEKRVAKEMKTILANYYADNGYYPYPAQYNHADCRDVGSMGYFTDCRSDDNTCRGRFPDRADTAGFGGTVDWVGSYDLPDWFSYNLWGQTIYYTVGDNFLKAEPSGCSLSLTLDGTSGTRGIFIMPGTPLGSIIRNNPSQSNTASNYFEDTANQDGWTSNNDSYVTPSASSNDKLVVFP
jgi:type II secretory pathway pseudopilin PulG